MSIYYLAKINSTYCSKNKLHTSICDYIKLLDRRLIPARDVEMFCKDVINYVDELNKKHPRCTPVKAEWYETPVHDFSLSFRQEVLSDSPIINFYLYRGEKE